MKRFSSSLARKPLVTAVRKKPKNEEVEVEEEEDEPPEDKPLENETKSADVKDESCDTIVECVDDSNQPDTSSKTVPDSTSNLEAKISGRHYVTDSKQRSRNETSNSATAVSSTSDPISSLPLDSGLIKDADGMLLPRRNIRDVAPASYDVEQTVKEDTAPTTKHEVPSAKAKKSKASHCREKKAKLQSSLAELKSQLAGEEKINSFSNDNPEFSSWLPPSNQTGDGKTHLNEKYGY